MKAYEIEKDEREFEELLNETYGTVTICGQEFDQGSAYKELDPVGFRCALSDEPIQYGCSTCDAVFDSEDDANECCIDEIEEDEDL